MLHFFHTYELNVPTKCPILCVCVCVCVVGVLCERRISMVLCFGVCTLPGAFPFFLPSRSQSLRPISFSRNEFFNPPPSPFLLPLSSNSMKVNKMGREEGRLVHFLFYYLSTRKKGSRDYWERARERESQSKRRKRGRICKWGKAKWGRLRFV